MVAALAVLALTAPTPAGALTMSDRDSVEDAVVSKINAIRQTHGLHQVSVVSRLDEAADDHATSMAAASYFRHEFYTPTRATPWTAFSTWIRWYWPGPGYSSWSAGENLAWGAPSLSASGTVKRWMASPGHRANSLHPAWRKIGVSAVHVRDPRGYYASWDDVTIVAAEFGARR